MEKEPGYVYILTNPSFREDWVKIGKSSREVNIRSKELDNTAVPLPFEIFATIRTVKYNEVEKLVHKTIDRADGPSYPPEQGIFQCRTAGGPRHIQGHRTDYRRCSHNGIQGQQAGRAGSGESLQGK